MAHIQINETDVVELLKQSPEPEVQTWVSDASVIASLLKILNATLEMAVDATKNGVPTPGGAAKALTNKAFEMSKPMINASDSKGLKAANAAIDIGIANGALKSITSLSPGKAAATVTMVGIQKLLILGGMQNQHKCKIAIASWAVSTGLSLPAATTGIGAVVPAINFLAGGIESYGACTAK